MICSSPYCSHSARYRICFEKKVEKTRHRYIRYACEDHVRYAVHTWTDHAADVISCTSLAPAQQLLKSERRERVSASATAMG
jgi:hypothetical protein